MTTLGDVAGASRVGSVRAWSGVRGGTPTEVQEVHDATRVSTQAPELRARPGPRRCRRDPAVAQEDAPDWASTISGPVVLSGWQSSPAEGNALTQTLLSFQAKYPNIPVDYQPIAGDYPTVMAAKFASGEVPDLFYVNADYAQEWIDQGLLPAARRLHRGRRHSTRARSFPATPMCSSKDGDWYGFPKDGNTIGMAYNTDLVTTPPTTMDELLTVAEGAQGHRGADGAPMCLNPGLDRGLAFLYANGGELLNADGTASAIETDASKAAVQWYLDLFKNGLGMTASDLGAGWCGEALGKGSAAIAFEGGWLDPYMRVHVPGHQVRVGGDAGRHVRRAGDDLVHGLLLHRRRLARTRTRASRC